jgi:hypothetical protein
MIRALMKKVLIICLLLVSCGKETPAPPQKTAVPAPPAPAATYQPPQKVGDYAKAVEWMRSAPGFKFDITIGNLKASGDLARPLLGQERLRVRAKGEEWSAERQRSGVAWSRNGKRETNEPEYADRIYQWMVFFPDPQKTAPPRVVGNEGDDTHIRFTTSNTNETEDVWVRRSDNHLVRLKTSGSGSAFPAVEMNIR